jgi:outer membrane protein TolC
MPLRLFSCLFLLLAGLLCAQQAASGVRTITLEEAWELALASDPDLKKTEIDLNVARLRASSLWAQVMPAVTAKGGVGYNFPLNDAAPDPGPSYTAEIGLSLGLSAGLPYTMKSLKLAYQLGTLNYENARSQLKLAVSKSFYALLADSQNLRVLEAAATLAREQYARNETAYRSGYKGELEYLQSRMSAENAALSYEKARAAYDKSLLEFCAALGLAVKDAPLPRVELSGSVEAEKIEADAQALLARFPGERPELAAKRGALEKLEVDAKQKALAAKAPTLSLSAGWGAGAGKDFVWDGDDSVKAGVTLSIPISPWIPRSKENQETEAAKAEAQKARIELADAAETDWREIHSLCADLETGWRQVEIARLQEEVAERSYALSREAYNRGTIGFLDYETAGNKRTEANVQLLQSELDYRLLVLELASRFNISEEQLRGVK